MSTKIISTIFIYFYILYSIYAKKPGECDDTDDCKIFGDKNYECVSVITKRDRIDNAAQCIPSPSCSGTNYGYCPTFTGWTKNYQPIRSVCGFTEPDNCINKQTKSLPFGNSSVICSNYTSPNNNQSYLVIYSCIDVSEYQSREQNFGMNITDQLNACSGEDDNGLCNGHGTCVPTSTNSEQYECLCNSGFSDEDNCLEAINNDCSLPGQCGEKGECDVFAGECICENGYTGNQCLKCDPNSSNACDGNGICNEEGKCTCFDNYDGNFCNKFKSPESVASGKGYISIFVMIFSTLITTIF